MANELDSTYARRAILGLLLMSCVVSCATRCEMKITDDWSRLFFPHMAFDSAQGERVTSIEVTVLCGRFRSLAIIPDDWSVEVVSPTSERTTLKAEAGHGAAALWSVSDLDGAIVISTGDASCFDIAATIVTTALDHERRYQFTRSDLILKR
jgi:transposase InsO family protein